MIEKSYDKSVIVLEIKVPTSFFKIKTYEVALGTAFHDATLPFTITLGVAS